MNWAAIEHHGYAALAVLGTLLAVALVWTLPRRPVLWRRVASWRGVVPPFVNITGTLFGLTLAFIANDTWASRDAAIDAVRREAEGLRNLLILAEALPGPQEAALQATVRDYGVALAGEWPALREARADADASHRADTLLRVVAALTEGQARDGIGPALLDQVLALRADRDLRVGLTQTHLNPLKWLGMAVLGFLTIVSIAAVHLENMRAGMLGVTLFALAAAPSAAIVLMQGNPFQEPAAVRPEALLAAVGAVP